VSGENVVLAFATHAASGRPARSAPLVVRPIFVVEDDEVSRRMLCASLAGLGLVNPTVELADGDQAMAELYRRMEEEPETLPVLLLLDRRLPGSSGVDVLRWMRLQPALRDVPIVMLSGDDDAVGVTEAYQLGVRSYLVKPVGFAALGLIVREMGLPWLLT
jgi:CheY-like chemotaxis protein